MKIIWILGLSFITAANLHFYIRSEKGSAINLWATIFTFMVTLQYIIHGGIVR